MIVKRKHGNNDENIYCANVQELKYYENEDEIAIVLYSPPLRGNKVGGFSVGLMWNNCFKEDSINTWCGLVYNIFGLMLGNYIFNDINSMCKYLSNSLLGYKCYIKIKDNSISAISNNCIVWVDNVLSNKRCQLITFYAF